MADLIIPASSPHCGRDLDFHAALIAITPTPRVMALDQVLIECIAVVPHQTTTAPFREATSCTRTCTTFATESILLHEPYRFARRVRPLAQAPAGRHGCDPGF